MVSKKGLGMSFRDWAVELLFLAAVVVSSFAFLHNAIGMETDTAWIIAVLIWVLTQIVDIRRRIS
jgi:small basic protein